MSLVPPLTDLLSKVNALDDILECPVCLDHLSGSGSVPQCIQGHHVCRKCVLRVDKCPLCESKFIGTRNYLAETIITKFEEIKNALKIINKYLPCTEVKKPSPVIKLEQFPCGKDYCFKTLTYDGMILHINEVHREDLIDEAAKKYYNYTEWWSIVYKCGFLWEKIIYIENMGIFFLKINISKKGNVYGYVLNVKPTNSTLNFYYEINAVTHSNRYLCFDGPVVSTANSFQKGQYLDLGDALYQDNDDNLFFNIYVKIIRV